MEKKHVPFTTKLLEDSDNLIEMLMAGSTRNKQRWTPPILSVDDKFIDAGKEVEWIEGFKVVKK